VVGLALDPLMLVMPFLITARAVSHAIQQHDRYYEEFERCNWHKRRAIVASFAEMFVPTFSGIACDAFGVLVILLVPVAMLQKLAITASWWILAMTVAELLLNPIVYYYLKPPDPALVIMRDRGAFRKVIERFAGALLSTTGRVTTVAIWAVGALVALYFLRGLTIGDPTSASPLLWEDSEYNVSHNRIQEKFGGVEPLIVVADGYDRDAMKEPHIIKSMESFQRQLERDPSVGYSFSLADILRGVNMVFHELEPKWGVIPDNWVDVGGLFFLYFAGSPPTETEKYVTSDYKTAHVTFFCKDHKGENVRRLVYRSKQFIFGSQLRDLGISVREENRQVFVSAVAPEPAWEKAGPSWIVSSQKTGLSPFKVGDRFVRLGKYGVTDLESFQESLSRATASNTLFDAAVIRDGSRSESTIGAPWKAAFKLAGGLIGVLAAANEELVRNDVLLNFLGFFTIWVILLFTYRSFACGFYLLAPLICSNMVVNAFMAANNIGVNIHTLPLVTVGVGFGIDYALYIVSRIIDEIRVRGDLTESVREALVTSGKAVTFTAIVMANSTAFWIVSRIRFNAEMGGLLALWMLISYLGSQTLLPVLIVLFRPRFITREAGYYDARQVQVRASRAKK
jgi:predicted RND superfamily exporter protein